MKVKFFAGVLILSGLLVAANKSYACGGGGGGNQSPVADLQAKPEYVIVGRSVTLDGSDSYDPDGSIVKYEWEWDFNYDGPFDCNYYETSSDHPDGVFDGITTHTYSSVGTYEAMLMVTDNGYAISTYICDVYVGEDSDSDDLPDAWEDEYDLDPNDANDADTDLDEDGYNNLSEYLHGTEPNDGTNVPSENITIRVPSNIDSIQGAINVSIDGDTIEVSEGRYYENVDLNGKKITLTSTNPNNPDVVAATIIDGNSFGPVVTFGPSEETDSALRGFTITGADDPYTNHYGGIYCSYSSAQITDCVIYGNNAEEKEGGGIYMEYSSVQITDCVIYENIAEEKEGGGIYIKDESEQTQITDCVIYDNSASAGGGIYIKRSTPLIKNCIFSNNEAGGGGGGIYIWSGDSPITVENCVFLGNEANKGGGIYDDYTSVSVTIKNCVFSGNIAKARTTEGKGGAIYNMGSASCCRVVDIYNCTFWGNTAEAEGKGGAICNYPKDYQVSATLIVNIYNCILWGNHAIQDGGGPIYGHDIYNWKAETTLNTCDIESQDSDYLYHEESDPGSISVELSCIYDDPLFVNSNNPSGPDDVFGTSDDGLRLQPHSPCVDAADDSKAPETGIFGQERVDIPYGDGTSVTDIGAYETPFDRMYVNENATFNPEASGLFWDDAFVYLQDALKQAKDFDFAGEIWVAAGTYYPDCNKANPDGTGNRDSSFELINGVGLYGGFAGNEIYLHQRSWAVNKTILSGDIDGDDVLNSDNSFHVVVGADGAILDGFTITGGNADGSGDGNSGVGGGIYCDGSSPTIGNCTITGNDSLTNGGGIYNYYSSSTLTNCILSGNSANDDGGGMYNYASSPTLINCTFHDNSAKDGGGIYIYGHPKLTSCTFNDNTANNSGGGIYIHGGTPALTNCPLNDNTANNSGGGIYIHGGLPALTNCTFSGNCAGDGGGMYNDNGIQTLTNCAFSSNTANNGSGGGMYYRYSYGGSQALINCVFSGNSATTFGGGMWIESDVSGFPTLTNCTFSGNTTSDSGGGMYNYEQSSPTLTNCIFWNNSDGGGSDESAQIFGGLPVVDYCCIRGLTGSLGGQGNRDVNPNFVDVNNPVGPDGVFGTNDDGLRLRVFDTRHGNLQKPFSGSCIDSADDTVAPDKDMTGRGRRDVPYIPNNGKGSTDYTDMGAYESPMVWYVDNTNSNIRGRGWSWNFVLDDLQEAISKAVPGDEIWVAAGEYKPGSERSDTFYLDVDKAIAIYGGFNGTEYGRYQRNWKANETILSGNIGEIIDDNGDIVYTDNCYHVVKIDCDDVILDGFTVTGGYAYTGDWPPSEQDICGGGIYIDKSSPKIANCIIRENYANPYYTVDPDSYVYGGLGHGMFVDGGSPTVTNCIFYDNRRRNVISGCPGLGGGMYNRDASSTVTDCIFIGNWARDGAGMYNSNSSPVVMNCIFRENVNRKSYNCGGSMCFKGNGGGVYNCDNSSAIVTNCIFNSNYASDRGGGIYNKDSCLILSNCTFIWNRAYEDNNGGGGAYLYQNVNFYNGDLTEITNSIFWDNYSQDNANQIVISGIPPIIQYCDIQGGYEEGEGNINSDPEFVNEPKFYDKTIEDGTDNTVKVADASIYTVGDIIEYGDDDISRMVTKVDYDSNAVTFAPPLGGGSEQSKEIKNWGLYAIVGSESYNDFEIKGNIARLQPTISPCIDKGLDEGLPRDTTDLDGDGDMTERIPYDIVGVPRIQKIAGNETSIDIGAFESGGLIANDKSVQVAEDTEKLFDLDNNDMYDLKEGDFLTYVVIIWPKHGNLSKTSDIGVSYMPDPEYHGSDKFYYRAYDGENYSETARVDITVISVDDEPVAVDDEAWINPEVSEITIDVLANDYDEDTGCNIYIKSITQPSHGIATDNGDGTIKYTPDDPFSLPETDTFTYDIEDSHDSSPVTDTATVTVNLNHEPIAVDDPDIETELKIIVVIDVLANDSDPDGHSLEIAEIEQLTKGQVVVYYHENGEVLIYMPDLESTEGYQTSFTYKVRDELGLESENSATVTVTVKDSTTISDSDEDMVSDDDEVNVFDTHPYKSDADGDGVYDGDEIMGGSDPTNPHSADYYDDPLPYITCFQPNQGYTPNETLDHQKGWKVEGGDCCIRYKWLRSLPLLPSWYCTYANISAGGTTSTTISKGFDDKGEEDNYSNIIRVKLYPAAGAMVKIYSGDMVIAGVKFEEVGDNRAIQYLVGEETWEDSGKPWERYSSGTYWGHNFAMLLKFEFSFVTSQYSIYWDAESDSDRYLTQSEDEVVTSRGFPDDIKSITRMEFISGSEDFGLRGLYINEEEAIGCYMASPSTGDDVKESRVPVKGWACSVNMSGYSLEWLAPDLDNYSEKFDEGQTAMNEVSGGEEHNILGYWNTGALPNSIYHVGLRIYQDMITNWGNGIEPVSLWDFYIDWGMGIDYCGVLNVATSGSVVSTTFHHVEEPDISVPWPGQFPFELRRIYDSGRRFIRAPFFPGWTNSNQIILVEDAGYYESFDCYESGYCDKKAKGNIADEDASGLAFGAIYVQYEDGSMHMFRHTTGSVGSYDPGTGPVGSREAIYTPYPDDGSGDYIKRTTDGKIPVVTEENSCHPSEDDLYVDYKLYRTDGTKIVFHRIESGWENPKVVSVPDGSSYYDYDDNEFYPICPASGGAVYKEIPCEYYDGPGGGYKYARPTDGWRLVTGIKTKSDRFGNTLEFEWNEWDSKEYYRRADICVPSVHKVSYNPGDGGATISIELKKSHPGNWSYDYAELKVDGVVERTVYYNLEYKLDWWGQSELLEVSTKNNEEVEKDYTSYEYWYDEGYLLGIFNDKLVEDGSYYYSSPYSSSSTWIYYDAAGSFTQRRDFVDEDNYLTRRYWWFFFEPDSGNDEDGQCVFNAVDFYRPTDLAPYRMDVAIKNEKGQLRAKLACPIGALSKLTTYDYETDPDEPLYDLPFIPKEIREYWHDYDCYSDDPEDDLVEVGRRTFNDYSQDRILEFGDNNPSVVLCDLNSQSVYDSGEDLGDDPSTNWDDTLIGYNEKDYHPYAGYNLETKTTWYQKVDPSEEEPQHEKPVETEYVCGLHDGTISGDDSENKYLIQEKVRIAETGVTEDDWAITYYEYDHKTCDGDPCLSHDPPHWDDAYALTRKIGPCGAVTLYEYDDNHYKQWVKVGPEEGEVPVERYCHDAIGQVLLKADTYGLVTFYDYDGFGDVVKVRTYYDPDALDENVRTSFTPDYYEANMSPRSTAIYDYDGQRRRIFEKAFSEEKGTEQVAVKETEYTAGSDQPRKIMFYKSQSDYDSGTYDSFIEYFYDGRGLKIGEENRDVTAAPNRWWYKDYYYDLMDRLTGTVWWDYEDESELKAVSNLYHGSGKKAYEKVRGVDSKGWWGLQRRTDYKYDVLDRLKDNIVTYDFDGEGLPERSATSYAYDDVGNQISVTDPKGNIIYTDYDNANRKIVEYFADDQVAGRNTGLIKRETGYYENNIIKDVKSYDYGDVGLEQKGTLLAHSEFEYDERGRVIKVTQDIDGTNVAETEYDYQDALDSTFLIDDTKYANVKITDAEDEVTRVAYNELGKTAKTLYPSGDYEQLLYNGDGTLKKKAVWDPDDEPVADPKWIEYDYDEFARLKKIKYPPDNETYYIEYFYDGFGRKTQVTDSRDANDNIGGTGEYANKISYEYDPLDQLIGVTDQDGYHIRYSYRGDGQKQTITVTEPDNPDNKIYAVEYGYDIAGRITHVNEPVLEFGYQFIAGFDYDDNGNRSQINYFLSGQEAGSTVSINYDYNPDNSLTYFSTTGGPTFSFDATGDVDGLGRLWAADETLTKTDSSTVAHTLTYQYDMLSQLTDATMTNIGGNDWAGEYTYYKNGDMASRTITGTANTTFSYTGNQMAGASGGETFSLDWDLNGNMKDLPYSGVTELTYNWDNKLRSGQNGTKSISIRYDPLGNRIWKDSSEAGQRKYIVDIVGDLPVILLELDPDSSNSIVKTYIYGNSQIIAQHDGDYAAGRYFYLHDRLGSVRQIIDTSGNVKNRYTFNPFGKGFLVEREQTIDNSFKFTGQYHDLEIRQYYLRARQYHPHIGRFTTRDPVFGKFEQPLSLHKYLYCMNEPINRIDLSGEFLEFLFTNSFVSKMRARTAAAGTAVMGYAKTSLNQLVAMRNFIYDLLTSGSDKGFDLGLRMAQQRGMEGERVARTLFGFCRNTQRFYTAAGNYRIPDGLSGRIIFEVKNVAYLSRTEQIRDLINIAKEQKTTLTIIVRETTIVSEPLLRLAAKGRIIIEKVL